jgi:hypothetical protein
MGFGLLQLALESRDFAIGKLAGTLELTAALGDGKVVARRFKLQLEICRQAELLLFGLPASGQRLGFFLDIRTAPFRAAQPVLRGLVVSFFSASRSIFSCMIRRSSSSSSSGLESTCILSRAADSSTRSMALSGRKRSVM